MTTSLKRYAKVPRERRAAVKKNLKPGVTASIAKLEELGYDPITSLVITARKLQTEILYHEACREGLVMNPVTGKARYYNVEAHARMFDQVIKIGTSLLEYQYVKPKAVEVDKAGPKRSLTIQLTDETSGFMLEENGE